MSTPTPKSKRHPLATFMKAYGVSLGHVAPVTHNMARCVIARGKSIAVVFFRYDRVIPSSPRAVLHMVLDTRRLTHPFPCGDISVVMDTDIMQKAMSAFEKGYTGQDSEGVAYAED